MVKKIVYSKRGVGTALGAVFYIGLVILSLITLIVISNYQMKYLQARDEMIDWDIKRLSEDLNIISINQPSKKQDYTFDIALNNTGGVLVKIVRIYIYDNKDEKLWIFDKQKTLDENGFINGEIMPGEGNHTINVKAQKPLNETLPYRYRIIVCTERGRQFSFNYPQPPPTAEGIPGGGYAIIISSIHNNFQYMDNNHAATYFKSAYIKPVSKKSDHPLYRLCINNTTNKNIILLNNCSMLQISTAGGQIKLRYIVSNSTTIWDSKPRKFTNQIINSYSGQYLYFASESIDDPDWLDDPTQGYYTVSFIICFKYEGETEVRSIATPSLIQWLT